MTTDQLISGIIVGSLIMFALIILIVFVFWLWEG